MLIRNETTTSRLSPVVATSQGTKRGWLRPSTAFLIVSFICLFYLSAYLIVRSAWAIEATKASKPKRDIVILAGSGDIADAVDIRPETVYKSGQTITRFSRRSPAQKFIYGMFYPLGWIDHKMVSRPYVCEDY
jgi:hypothetical protein